MSDSPYIPANALSGRADTLGSAEGNDELSLVSFEEIARMRATMDSSPLGIAFIDATGNTTFINAQWGNICGRPVAELIGSLAFNNSIRDEVESQRANAEASAALDTKGHWSGRFEVARPDGSTRVVRNWVSKIEGLQTSYVSILEDITETVNAFGDADHLRALLSGTADIALIFDSDGRLEYANSAARRILEIRESNYSELTRLDSAAILRLTPESVERYQSEIAPSVLEFGRWSGETTYYNSSGEIVTAVTDASKHVSEGGQVFYTVTSHDVSNYKALTERLEHQETWFRTIVAQSADAIFVTRRPDGIIYASPKAEELLGIPLEEIIGTKLRHKVHPDDIAGLPHGSQNVAAIQRPYVDYPIRVLNADGNYRFCEATAVNFGADIGNGASMITIKDISRRRLLEEMVQSESRRFTEIVQNLSDGVTILDSRGSIRYQSAQAKQLFGGESSGTFVESVAGAIHEDDRSRVLGRIESALFADVLRGDSWEGSLEFRVLGTDNNWRYCETKFTDLRHELAVAGVVLTTRDITDRRRSETLLHEQAEFLRLVASSAPISAVLAALCDLVEETFVGAKAAVMRVSEERLSFAGGPRMPAEFVDAMQSVPLGAGGGLCGIAVETGEPVYSLDVATDGRLEGCRDLLLRNGFKSVWSTPVSSSDEDAIIASIAVFWHELHEVTLDEVAAMETLIALCSIAVDRKEYETRLTHQAHHDSLTGLPNRSLFTELLSIATARASRGNTVNAVMFIDLDRFKEVNDSLGHDAGDELLINVASRLRECSRASDTIARFGGDEFVVLCEDLDPESASGVISELAERLLASIDQPMVIKGQSLRVSASVGVAINGGNAKAAGMLRDADAAMYKAKKNGKARFEVFGDELRSSALHRLEMESGLRNAPVNGELVLEYQPVINLVTGSIEGVEALVRWLHPTQGMLQPASFIEIAEETGAISEVGNFVLREACSQLGRWIMDGDVSANFTVSVNVSARQFEGSDLIEVVRQSLALSGLIPSQLVIEITEGTLMEPASIEALRALHDLGVQVAIDDFGTGYSSLYYLKRFPVDIVKIDRSFVDGLGHDPDDEAIVSAVLGLGHALGLLVVAEGVESELQMQALSALGCDSAQGFLISRPLPAGEIPSMMAN
ncbi:MAG: bifunctional diguanylate cyclase/phosphodiesterase [Actinomycetes bacterium]